MNVSINIPTAEQGEVSVRTSKDSVHIGFYHEQMELTRNEALALVSAVAVALRTVQEDAR